MKKKSKQSFSVDSLKEIYSFLTSKVFLKHLLLIAAFVITVLLLTLLWLRIYTNHGQKLELPDYIGENIELAKEDAVSKSFEIIVNDSVHIVGKKGGEIIEQNPKPLSMVKENRKIYVSITKFDADQFDSESLPPLYGHEFDRKKRDLAFQDINCKVIDFKFDPGEPNHILEVYYDGETIEDAKGRRSGISIERGGTLEFILSKRSGQQLEVPDLTCKPYNEAVVFLEVINLKIGDVVTTSKIDEESTAWVYDQEPKAGEGSFINSGESITLYVAKDKPDGCQ